MKLILIFFLAALNLNSAFAQGNTSGGGSKYGIQELYPAYEEAVKLIHEAKDKYFSARDIRKIDKIIKLKPRILAPSSKDFDSHPAKVGEIEQTGSAQSFADFSKKLAIIVIKQSEWEGFDNRTGQLSLMVHELCVLARLEHTGDYHLSGAADFKKFISDHEDNFNSLIFEIKIYKKSYSEKKQAILGEKIAELELRPFSLDTGSEKQAFSQVLALASFDSVYVQGCMGKDGYLKLWVSSQIGTETKPTCIEDTVNQADGDLIPATLFFNPHSSLGLETKTTDLNDNLIFAVTLIRY